MELELTQCSGDQGRSVDVGFAVSVNRYGRVSITIDELAMKCETEFLYGLMDSIRIGGELPSLQGVAPDGWIITGRCLFVAKQNLRSDSSGAWLGFQFTTHDLRMTKSGGADGVRGTARLEYILPKLKSFTPVSLDAPDGKYVVAGVADTEDRDELGGIIAVDLPEKIEPNIASYDKRVECLLDILSLADGRLLRWSIRKCFHTTGAVELKLRGIQAKGNGGRPLFPYLNMRQTVEAALNNLTPETNERFGLHVAISWVLLNSQFIEANFQGLMTALEHWLL